MPENKTSSCSPTGDDQTKGNATSQALVPFVAPQEDLEIFREDKKTNTEGVNKGIYFSYPCRRLSCSLVNIPAPCVNKMISHIEDVESKIQVHLKQFETTFEEWRRIAAQDLEEGRLSEAPPGKAEPEEERDEKCPELKQEMETLLSEAMHLIKSLETDRAEAEAALKRQQLRRKKINSTIDSWSIWRHQEIPLAVQKEHEIYLRDILELRWHIEDASHKLRDIENQKTQWEEANDKVQADIDYMNEHISLLNSKLNQELEALMEVDRKKSEIMALYKQVHDELQEAIENSIKVTLKATLTREEMEKDLENDEQSIISFKKKAEELTSLYKHYSSLVENVNINIEKNEEAATVVQKTAKKTTDELSAASKKLEELKRIYHELVWMKNNYENEYQDLVSHFYCVKEAWNIEISNIAKDLADTSLVYSKMMEENKKLASDIETMADTINESVRKKSQFENEIQGLMAMKSKNDDYLSILYRDAYHIGAIFHLTKCKTEDLEEQISEVRRKFKGREDFLKNITLSEVNDGMKLQRKLFLLQEEEELEREELLGKKAIYTLVLAEVEEPLHEIEENAEKIKAIHTENFETLNNVIAQRDFVKTNVERTQKKLETKEKKTKKALSKTEIKLTTIFNEMEIAKTRTLYFEEKISKLKKDIEEKEKEKNIFDQLLGNLREQHLAVRFNKEHKQAIYDNLIKEKKNCEERLQEEEQRYRAIFHMRQKTLRGIKKLQEDSLEENLRLAQEYQRLQMTYLREKASYFHQYDRQLALNSSIRDKKQLCQLQRKVHKLWQKYLKLMVLHSRVRLAKFQTESQENILKIIAVQEESSNLMQHIVDFFKNLSSNPCENDD